MAKLSFVFVILALCGVNTILGQRQSQCVGIRGIPSDEKTKMCCEELRYGCAGIWPGQCKACSTILEYHVGEFNKCCREIPGGRAKTFDPWEQYSHNPLQNAPPTGSMLPNLSGYQVPGPNPQLPPQFPHFG